MPHFLNASLQRTAEPDRYRKGRSSFRSNPFRLLQSIELRLGHSSTEKMTSVKLPYDRDYILKNRRFHRRLARSGLKLLRSAWNPFGRFYHRARYPPYKPLKLRSRRRCSQSQSRLLMLPPEIRFIIWDYVMAGGPIALYRARDRITYDLIPENSPQSVTNITPQTIQKAAESRTNHRVSNTHKMSLLPVLQTCQMM